MNLDERRIASSEPDAVLRSAAPRSGEDRRATNNAVRGNLQLLLDRSRPAAKVSVVLLDWGVRESFHSLRYLTRQTTPRDQYELIWVEFYDRKPAKLSSLIEATQAEVLDTWLIMGYEDSVHYHKHRMYNAGIVAARGQIVVFCDSDAIFTPTFIENIINAFEQHPNAVVHLDEVRNYSKRFYPFNDPSIEEVLGTGCVNWTGSTTTGLDNGADMLHSANYGACMAAWREDLIRIGGADEHRDYLGYICGPYEMTFRLVNQGREERWLRNEYLYHVWHPNTSGCNVEYKGPDDGRGMSLPALEARKTGRVVPLKENQAIRQLRMGLRDTTQTMLKALAHRDDDFWHMSNTVQSETPARHEKLCNYSICCFRGTWYAVRRSEGTFDPEKYQHQKYSQCFTATSRAELLRMLPREPHRLRAVLAHALASLHPRRGYRFVLRLLGATKEVPVFAADDVNVHLVEQGYRGHNIIYWKGTWYALGQDEGAFDPAKIQSKMYTRCISGDSIKTVKAAVPRQRRVYRRLARLAGRIVRLTRV